MAQQPRNDILVPLLTLVCDIVAIEAAFLLSYWVRFFSPFTSIVEVLTDIPPLQAYIEGTLFIIPAWLLIFQSRRMYAVRRNAYVADEFIAIVKVVTIGMLIVMSAAFFYRAFSYSRVVFGLMWFFSIVLVTTGRYIVVMFERALYRRGKELKNVLIAGNGPTAARIAGSLARAHYLGLRLCGYIADSPASPPVNLPIGYLGTIGNLPEILARERADVIVAGFEQAEHDKLVRLVGECEGLSIEFMFVPAWLELLTSRLRVHEIEGIPLITVKGSAMTGWGYIIKRAFDFTVSLAMLIALSPLFLLVAAIIKLDSKGSVFFLQERIGLDGKRFTMVKFRSMKIGAHESDDLVGLGIKDDPRRTKFGTFLRKSSIDELPQLLNVLSGSMSLVGPRPERTGYVEKFKTVIPKYLDRHRVKTGITGWAQVNGFRGADTSLEERIAYDLYYIEHWSMTFDIKILLLTIREMFWSRSAE